VVGCQKLYAPGSLNVRVLQAGTGSGAHEKPWRLLLTLSDEVLVLGCSAGAKDAKENDQVEDKNEKNLHFRHGREALSLSSASQGVSLASTVASRIVYPSAGKPWVNPGRIAFQHEFNSETPVGRENKAVATISTIGRRLI